MAWVRGMHIAASRRAADNSGLLGSLMSRFKKPAAAQTPIVVSEQPAREPRPSLYVHEPVPEPPTDAAQFSHDLLASLKEKGLVDSATTDPTSLALENFNLKFEVLNSFVKAYQRDVPNHVLPQLTTLSEVVAYFQSPVPTNSTFPNLDAITELPDNLFIER
eukprot:m.231501 g.231501  ORF g.231501 m.231501 type:complete len:162 (-) comp12226_c0_seq1:72-557(-)